MKPTMDDAWQKIYDENAKRDIPIHTMSCWSEEGFQELFKITFKLIKKLKNVKTVLDVGCGPGAYCAELHKKGYDVTGIDYSKNVIDRAKKEHLKMNFDVGSAYNLPYKNESFDLVICIGLLQCVYDAEKVIDELARTAKKHIIISTLLRERKLEEPIKLLNKKLEKDTWPTRDYHPSEIEDMLDRQGYITTTITKHKHKLINDGFFIIATKTK